MLRPDGTIALVQRTVYCRGWSQAVHGCVRVLWHMSVQWLISRWSTKVAKGRVL